eukprot:4670291-Ditylum_brightwellii.AAC.1
MTEKSEDQDDFKLISSVLEGNFSNCKYRALGKQEINGEVTAPFPPERMCINNKRLNIWANQGKALVLDGSFKLDSSQRYLVDSMSFKMGRHICGISVGLFAYFGPYMVQISALFLGMHHAEEISPIKPGVNFLTMERISMLPPHCDGVVLVAWGEPYCENKNEDVTWLEVKEFYHGMRLVLNQYEESA